MKIYLQNNVKKFELTNEIIKRIWENTNIIEYEKYKDTTKDIFLNIWNNFNINYESYKKNLNIRNNYLFIKKWNNLIVEDDKDFQSFEIYKKQWYKVYNVKIWQNCSLWCNYCYLLSSNKFNPELTIYWNIKEEVKKFLNKNKWEKIVLNIWEYTDSFLFDKTTNLTSFFREMCLKNENLIVESRTKLQNLKINFKPIDNFVLWFSISINEMDIFWKKELILKKLDYIKELTHKGYTVSLKFDPIITLNWYDNEFFSKIKEMNLNKIHHFSVWTLRFSKNLWKIIWNCTSSKKCSWEFEFINWKYINKNRENIYNFFISKMNEIWITKYYLSMDPNIA